MSDNLHERELWVDAVRGLAICVMVPANMAPMLIEPHPWALRFVWSLATPIFVILAGMMVALNAIERLHEEFKRRIKTQTVLPCAETAAMLFWALLASGQITMRKVDGWQTLAEKPDDQIIDLARDRIASCRPKTRQSIPTKIATGP